MATWPEALPLLGCSPVVTGMGRAAYDLRGCDAVMSAGFAGACLGHLRPGDVILGGSASPEFRARVGAMDGEIRTLDHIASPAQKAALGREGVAAVDMETGWLAAAAAEAGLPLLAVRVIIDRVQDHALGLATARHYPPAAIALRRAVTLARRLWQRSL